MENGGFTFYWLAGNHPSRIPFESLNPGNGQFFLVFILIIIAMLIKAFNYLTEWPKFEKSFNRSDSQYIKNSLFEKSILSTVQRSIRRMSNVTLMRPNNVYNVSVHREGSTPAS